MSPSSVTAAEAQWLEQVAAMKAAIAELKLPDNISNVDTADDEDDDYFDLSSASPGPHDVWDFISDDDIDELGLDSGDLMDGTDGLGLEEEPPYGPQWFSLKCMEVSVHRDGLPAEALQQQILEALKSKQREDELQSLLTDVVGFDDLDFVIELISHRDEIVAALDQSTATASDEQPSGRLLTKAERDANLRRQDIRHKTAGLAAASSKEPQYPHVYKTFSAGNALSHAGKKYGLPPGSERLQFDKYEEYAIPAGKAGTLWPGHKLVGIKDLDGLCRSTFRGYETLNRMQSLVYPVAYKTSENMLICAPTGAVSLNLQCNIIKRYC